MVVKEVQGAEPSWSTSALLIQAAKKLLQSFSRWSIQYVKREANTVAYTLARASLLSSVNTFDLETMPDCVKDIVILEAS